jgi:hypothetical protein
MAKTYSLEGTGSFKLTDSSSNVLINFSHLKDFSGLSPETVQYGDIKFSSIKVINLDPIAARALLYVRNENTVDGEGITVKIAGTPDITISTLEPGEWMFVPVRTTADIKFDVNGPAGDRTAHYILIDA